MRGEGAPATSGTGSAGNCASGLRHVENRLLRRLSRTTSSGEFLPEVDGLRFLAIAVVVLHHVTASYLRITGRLGPVDLPAQWWAVFPKSRAVAAGYAGHFGVHLFFVISGFVLALPFARSYRDGSPRPDLRAYYLRRLVRLEPPYFLNLTIAFVAIVLSQPDRLSWLPHYLSSLAYLHGPIYGQSSWVNGVAWSLEVEVQFYVVMPLLALIFAVKSPALRRILLVAMIVAWGTAATRLIHRDANPRLYLSVIRQLPFFLAGFLLADLYLGRGHHGFRRGLRWDAVAITAGGCIFLVLTRQYRFYPLTPLLVVALYAGLFQGRVGHRLIRQRWAVVIGGMCYTIYLYHFMIIHLVEKWTMSFARPDRALAADLLLQYVLLVPPILLASAVLFVAFEKPFMKASRTLSNRLLAGDGRGTRPPTPC